MKKIISALLVLLMALVFAGCQKQIVCEIHFSDPEGSEGGMRGEMPAKSTLKDLFDALGRGDGAEFTYEVDENGVIVSVNGKENGELGYWDVTLNDQPLNDVIGNIALNDGDVCKIVFVPKVTEAIAGGWQVADVARTEMDEKEATVFAAATEKLLGENYEPVCVLATQVVSGTNYAFLARGTSVTASPASSFLILKVYEDLQGNVKLESVSEIDVTDIHVRADVDDNILGGWTVKDTGKPGSLGSEEAQSSFEKAMAEVLGVGYNPIQLLATQVVNGTNYIALVRGKALSVDDTPELYVISWYADLEGNSKVTEIKKFDLNYYVA